MPQLASITINDGEATPVAHVYAPVTTDGQAAQLKERSGLPAAYPSMDISVRPPLKNGDTYRLKISIRKPSTVTADGKTVVDHIPTASLEFLFSDRSTAQERKNIRVLLLNALQNATVISTVENLEPLY